MVKHGTAKKRRSGLKVTRKPPQNRHLRIIKSVVNKDIKNSYDKSKSPKENLSEFGLVADANNLNNTTNPNKKKKNAAFIGYLAECWSSLHCLQIPSACKQETSCSIW